FCLVLMRVVFMPTRSFWQELAWLFSAVFWCALGALCYLFISSHRRMFYVTLSPRIC
ncbi:inner membrane protein YbjM, partial [Salmonella enterica subsp. enterica serovar Kentucky]|nr:inner membrane protein YbjM [Salmonella enterica subsp. enterica serovar Kentucky]